MAQTGVTAQVRRYLASLNEIAPKPLLAALGFSAVAAMFEGLGVLLLVPLLPTKEFFS